MAAAPFGEAFSAIAVSFCPDGSKLEGERQLPVKWGPGAFFDLHPNSQDRYHSLEILFDFRRFLYHEAVLFFPGPLLFVIPKPFGSLV
jgi:hypothetical protein